MLCKKCLFEMECDIDYLDDDCIWFIDKNEYTIDENGWIVEKTKR